MPTLQIRNLPDDLYHLLTLRAEQAHRSLAQQTIVELRRALSASGDDRRRQVLNRLAQEETDRPLRALEPAPEVWVREDRER